MSCRHLEVRNLTVLLSGATPRVLVDDLSLRVDGGASLAVIGESGAGKSMTALAILGLLPRGIHRTGGDIVVNDRDLHRLDKGEMRLVRAREVGMIMQNPMSAFDPIFTIYRHFKESIAAAGRPAAAADPRRAAAAALAEVRLEEPDALLDAYPFQLSGGMLQRVMIALALVNDPAYLIADEPTSDLDLVSQRRILDLIRERRQARHLGLLLITHDLSVAAYMAESVVIMQGGRAVERGPVDRVLGDPGHPYARELVRAHHGLYGERFDRLFPREAEVSP